MFLDTVISDLLIVCWFVCGNTWQGGQWISPPSWCHWSYSTTSCRCRSGAVLSFLLIVAFLKVKLLIPTLSSLFAVKGCCYLCYIWWTIIRTYDVCEKLICL